ncbi:hypothetical protein IB248_00075 [Rhizobium sp. RHZ01]|nr:hypothetical protein [Rhizobium sp. RHZ01]
MEIDVDNQVGLEIGPLDKPLVKRESGRQIFYADYSHRDALVQASIGDPNVNTSLIPTIDYILALMPEYKDRSFDYIVASHVGEHVPDFIGWTKTLLALPDKRYTFDCYRTESTAGDMIEAHLERRSRPPVSSIYDGFSKAVHADAWYLWEGVEPPAPFEIMFTKRQAFSLAENALRTGVYRDCHCWVFTADRFREILDEVASLGLIEYEWVGFTPPTKYMIEFYVMLGRASGSYNA